ncbi:hypothetical protein SAMN02910317_02978 [Ruminococcaceae bacterium FB2012]|nr:hypothetical protein SAMN02910317_02978 [Ruminococcaceae bacterium FB2012]
MKNKLFKRITASAAALTMFGTALLSEFPVLTARANSSITYIKYSWNVEEKKLETTQIATADYNNVTGGGSFPTEPLSGTYYIQNSLNVYSFREVKKGETLNLIVPEGVTLNFTKGFGCGYDTDGKYATLNIFGGGKIIATGEKNCAGIGGKDNEANGIITIHGTTIEATGGKHAAGIGGGEGGQDPDEKGEKSKITIYAGDITATGGIDGAGIGGGDEQPGARTYIYSGKVNASSLKHGAGIGGGDEEGTFGIHIYDGKITATGGEGGAGIGAGEEGGNLRQKDNGGGINIYGGEITAKGGGISEKDNVHAGAGIGGGWDEDMSGTIFISGDTTKLTAQGGIGAAGIGAGRGEWPFPNGDMKGEITIECGDNSDLKIIGGSGGAGIGAGFQGNMQGKAYIFGGIIKITSGYEAAGIGGGREGTFDEGGEGGTVYIGGGDITIDLLSNAPQLADSHAIGRGALDEKTGTLYISKDNNKTGRCMRVDYRLFREKEGWSGTAKAGSRTDKCHAENDVHITVCNHKDVNGKSGLTYTIPKNDNYHHKVSCKYCGYSATVEHESGTCPCGHQEDTKYDVKVNTKSGSSQTYYEPWTETCSVVNGKTYFCPECEHKPSDMRFIGWAVNGDTANLKQSGDPITVNEDKTLEAQYADLYNITVDNTIPDDNWISVSPAKADEGDQITVTAHPYGRYRLKSIIIKNNGADGEVITTANAEPGQNKFTITMPAADIYITAEFEIDKSFITGASLSLGGEIGINIYLSLPDFILNDSGAYMTVQGPNDDEPVKKLVSGLEITENGYLINYKTNAAQMGENVSFRLYTGENENIPIWSSDQKSSYSVFKYAVKDYLDYVSEHGPRDLFDLVDTMRSYGTWAREYLISTGKVPDTTAAVDDPVDVLDVSTSDLSSYKLVKTGDIEGVSVSLILESKTALRIYYSGDAVDVTVKDFKNGSVQFNTGTKGGKNYVEILDIGAPELDEQFTVTFGTLGTVKVSALSFAELALSTYENDESKSELCNMARSLYLYFDAASHYFEYLEG